MIGKTCYHPKDLSSSRVPLIIRKTFYHRRALFLSETPLVIENISCYRKAFLSDRERHRWGHKTHISWIVHCGLHALEVTNLNVVTSNLLRTCFKSQSLPNSIIFITERHLHMFLTLCSQLRFTKLRRRSV